MPAAPPMFSITSGWPSRVCSSAAAARMMTSVTLPAAIDTMTRIGFDGYCCAWPAVAPSKARPSIKPTRTRITLPPNRFLDLSLDHFIGLQLDGLGYRHADRLRGLQVDDKLEPLRRLHRKVGRRRALQDLLREECGLLEHLRKACAIGHQAAGRDIVPVLEHRRQALLKQEADNFMDAALMHGIVGDQDYIGPFAHQSGKRAVEIVAGARLDGRELQSEPGRGGAELFEDHAIGNVVGIPEQRGSRC